MATASERTVVIGAGVGGLAAAARLAHAGLDVTLIEAQGYPGGKMRSVESPAGPIDAGPTVLTMRHVFDRLFEDCGARLDASLTLHREAILARHFWPDGSTLDLFADPDQSADAVGRFAGARAAREFRAFAARASQLFDAFETPIINAPTPELAQLTAHVLARPRLLPALAPLSTLASSLKRQFTDPRLRQLFGRYATYVGGTPFDAPAVLGLIAASEARGVWRVEGGLRALADAMAALATSCGANIILNARATRIEMQGDTVAAVHLGDGTRLPADRVVFNGDPRALSAGHLGPAAQSAVPQSGTEPRSLSARVWTFATQITGPDLAHHNVFFGADPRREFDPIAAGHPPEDPTLYLCAQDRGTGISPPALERVQIIENAAPIDIGHPEETAACRTRMTQALGRFGLRFTPSPADAALTTPWDFEALFPASLGSLYGRSPHGLTATFARPTARTKLRGLYLAGGGVHPGAGVPMATLSGKHAAEAILTDRASTSKSRRTVTHGGMSTASPTMAPAPSRSSLS